MFEYQEVKNMRCPKCNFENKNNTGCCSKCGAEQEVTLEEEPVEKTDNCPYCDAKLAKDATFCSACGTKLEV